MKAIAWKYPYFWQPFLEKTQNISKTVKPIKKVLRTKVIENLISYMQCAIRFNVSPTIIVLLQQILDFYKNRRRPSWIGYSHLMTRTQDVHLVQKCYLGSILQETFIKFRGPKSVSGTNCQVQDYYELLHCICEQIMLYSQ